MTLLAIIQFTARTEILQKIKKTLKKTAVAVFFNVISFICIRRRSCSFRCIFWTVCPSRKTSVRNSSVRRFFRSRGILLRRRIFLRVLQNSFCSFCKRTVKGAYQFSLFRLSCFFFLRTRFLKGLFFNSKKPIKKVNTSVRATTSQNQPVSLKVTPDCHGTGIFIPKNPAIIVGIARRIVTIVSFFIVSLALFEITEPYASIVTLRIFL